MLNQKVTSSSWLQALDLGVQHKVDLHIAFYANADKPEFKYGATTYHVIPPDSLRKSSIRGLVRPHILHDEDLALYLGIVEKVKPDIVHIHGTETSFGCLLGQLDVPALLSIQGLLNPIAPKYRGDISSNRELRSKPDAGGGLKGKIFNKSFHYHNQLLSLLAQRESKVIPAAKHVMGRTIWDRLVTSVLAPAATYHLGDEIMREEFYHAEWKPTGNSTFTIHSTTGDQPMKGFVTICETLALLNDLGANVKWQVAGLDASSAIVKLARRKLGARYPAGNLVLLGKLTAEALVVQMMKADLYVLSSFIENSPNSLCEAMLLGMPCIATNVGGTPSILKDGEEGMLVQPGDPWVMAGAIQDCRANYGQWVEKGQKARATALHRHDPERIASQVVEVYRQLLGQ